MVKSMPQISVIIVNWNGKRFLKNCIESVLNQTYKSFEIIVVDNGSTDGSIELLETQYCNKTILIKNKTNYGFARGNNIGIVQAKGDYIVTLNNDTVADEKWLSELVQPVLDDPKIGLCGSKILLTQTPGKIDSVGINIFPDCMSRQRGHNEFDSGQYTRNEEILLPSACAALYRKKMLDEIGLFDEDFFAYCEDTDIGLRARLLGWKAILVPSAIIYHYYSGTLGKASSKKAFLVERNHFWVAIKILPWDMFVMALLYTPVRLTAQFFNIIKRSNKKKKDYIADVDTQSIFLSLLHAYVCVILSIPRFLNKRKEVWKKKQFSNLEIKMLFSRYNLKIRHLYLDS